MPSDKVLLKRIKGFYAMRRNSAIMKGDEIKRKKTVKAGNLAIALL